MSTPEATRATLRSDRERANVTYNMALMTAVTFTRSARVNVTLTAGAGDRVTFARPEYGASRVRGAAAVAGGRGRAGAGAGRLGLRVAPGRARDGWG
jgi:hypothetical protein